MTGTRRYESAVRQEHSRQTRRRVIAAARQHFVSRGYLGTTMADVASTADVSQDTVYKGFGTKATLLKAVVDGTLAGDDAPVPFDTRPQAEAIRAARDADTALRIYAQWAAATAARIAPVALALRTGRGNVDVDAMLAEMDRQRLAGVRTLARTVCAKPGAMVRPTQLEGTVFILASVETYDLAVNRLGWSERRYATWLAARLVTDARGEGGSGKC